MIKRRICAALFAAIILAGCDTTGAAPTPQPGFTSSPTAGAATAAPTTGAPGEAPTIDPSLPAVVYPTPGTAEALPNAAYPTPGTQQIQPGPYPTKTP